MTIHDEFLAMGVLEADVLEVGLRAAEHFCYAAWDAAYILEGF